MTTIKIKKSEFKKLYDIACDSWKNKFDEKFKKFTFSDTFEFEESFLDEMKKACTKEQLIIFNKLLKSHLKDKLDIFKFKTYSSVCKALKHPEITIKDFQKQLVFKALTEKQLNQLVGYARIKQLEQFFNQGWIPSDGDYKYWSYFYYYGSGWSFNVVNVRHSSSTGVVGLYKSRDIAEFVSKNFLKEVYSLIL